MNSCIIAGGGLAGLTAACYLASWNIHVTLLEASPKVGGRAYSLPWKAAGLTVDNGQHIMMGCYTETLKFLDMIGASSKVEMQRGLSIPFVDENGGQHHLNASGLPYPLNLVKAVLSYTALSKPERLELLSFTAKLPLIKPETLRGMSALDWLEDNGQNTAIRKAFWDIVLIGTMNTSPGNASAEVFARVLKRVFLGGTKGSSIVLPVYGLTEMYAADAVNFIRKKDGEVHTGEKVLAIEPQPGGSGRIDTAKRKALTADTVIIAVPPYALRKIKGTDHLLQGDHGSFRYASILTFHLRLKNNTLTEQFYGFIDSPLHWVFNKRSYITTVRSDANELSGKGKDELFEMTARELHKRLGIEREDILDYKMINEKRATFIPDNLVEPLRPGADTPVENLFLAGDWTDTGFPATIEGAVLSGRRAADKAAAFLANR